VNESVNGTSAFSHNIDSNGRIISIDVTTDEFEILSRLTYFYDPIGVLRRIDFLGSIEGVVIGVSSLDWYEFNAELATAMETRIISFEDITLSVAVDDSAGFVLTRTEFEYDDNRVVQELVNDDVDGIVDFQRDYIYNSDGTISKTLNTGTSANPRVFSYEQGPCNLNWVNSTHRYFCVIIER